MGFTQVDYDVITKAFTDANRWAAKEDARYAGSPRFRQGVNFALNALTEAYGEAHPNFDPQELSVRMHLASGFELAKKTPDWFVVFNAATGETKSIRRNPR